MAENSKPQLPVPKNPNWLLFCTGGLITTSGLGWYLRHAYAEEPKMALATYMVGTVGICLSNFSLRPVKKGCTPNWILMFTGGILSGAGFGYCLTLAMKEHPKSTTIAYLVGSLGYVLLRSSVYAEAVSGSKGRKTESRNSNIGLSPDQMSRVAKIAKEALDEDVCESRICTEPVEREKVKKECEQEPWLSIEKNFQQKMQEFDMKRNQCKNTTGDTRSGMHWIVYKEIKESEEFILKRESENTNEAMRPRKQPAQRDGYSDAGK